MLLYDPANKFESSTRTTTTSLSATSRYMLYLPDDTDDGFEHHHHNHNHNHHHHHHDANALHDIYADEPSRRHAGSSIEIHENGTVTNQPYYYEKHMLEDPYDAHGIRHGGWETGLCNPRVWLPMACGLLCGVPSIAVAQMRARLDMKPYGTEVVMELAKVLAIAGLPVVGYVALRKLQSLSKVPEQTTPRPRLPNGGAENTESFETTLWMVLLWTASLGVVVLLFFLAVSISDMRSKIRTRFQVPGTRGCDLCAVVFLPMCAVAQMSTHLRCLRPGRYSLARPETLPPYEY